MSINLLLGRQNWSHKYMLKMVVKSSDRCKTDCWTPTCINNSLNLLICSIREVGECPASICQHFPICVMKESEQCRQAPAHNLKFWRWVLVATQVGNSPCDVAHKASLKKKKIACIIKTSAIKGMKTKANAKTIHILVLQFPHKHLPYIYWSSWKLAYLCDLECR